jgi:hypothetical protein
MIADYLLAARRRNSQYAIPLSKIAHKQLITGVGIPAAGGFGTMSKSVVSEHLGLLIGQSGSLPPPTYEVFLIAWPVLVAMASIVILMTDFSSAGFRVLFDVHVTLLLSILQLASGEVADLAVSSLGIVSVTTMLPPVANAPMLRTINS